MPSMGERSNFVETVAVKRRAVLSFPSQIAISLNSGRARQFYTEVSDEVACVLN
jgi:hypothetical protein